MHAAHISQRGPKAPRVVIIIMSFVAIVVVAVAGWLAQRINILQHKQLTKNNIKE